MNSTVALIIAVLIVEVVIISVTLSFTRLRVWLAKLLCKGTLCLVARSVKVALLHDTALGLGAYVKSSGALQDPRRVKAYRTVIHAVVGIATLAQEIVVAPKRKKEVTSGNKEESKTQAA